MILKNYPSNRHCPSSQGCAAQPSTTYHLPLIFPLTPYHLPLIWMSDPHPSDREQMDIIFLDHPDEKFWNSSSSVKTPRLPEAQGTESFTAFVPSLCSCKESRGMAAMVPSCHRLTSSCRIKSRSVEYDMARRLRCRWCGRIC